MTDTLKTLLAKMQAPELRDQWESYWLFKPLNHKICAYVREAKGDYKDFWPLPTSPWLRKMPPIKLIQVEAFNVAAAQRDVVIEMLKRAIEQRDKVMHTYGFYPFEKSGVNEELESIAEAALGKM